MMNHGTEAMVAIMPDSCEENGERRVSPGRRIVLHHIINQVSQQLDEKEHSQNAPSCKPAPLPIVIRNNGGKRKRQDKHPEPEPASLAPEAGADVLLTTIGTVPALAGGVGLQPVRRALVPVLPAVRAGGVVWQRGGAGDKDTIVVVVFHVVELAAGLS